jgi:phosphate transport system substrate-binding protein
MASLARVWLNDIARTDPALRFKISARGSSTAPPTLLAGEATVGLMTREIRDVELRAFDSKLGFRPTGYRIALDAAVVFVHKSYPIQGLTLAELDAVFSKTRLCGRPEPVERWQDLGAEGEWAMRKVVACGLVRASGTRGFFREQALCGGRFRDDIVEQPGTASVLGWVAEGFCGIGYSGLAGQSSGREDLKILPIATKAGDAYVSPSERQVYSEAYPLWRYLYAYVIQPPRGKLPAASERFLRHALSEGGQVQVRETSFLPLHETVRRKELAKLD